MELKFNFDNTFVVSIGARSDEATRHVEIDVAKLPANALEAIFHYGLQRKFNDAIGGKDKTLDEKVKIVREMADRFYAGLVRKPRGEGSGEAPWMRFLRGLVRDNLDSAQKKEYKALDADKRDEWLDEIADKMDDAVRENYVLFAKELHEEDLAVKAKRAAMAARLKLPVSLDDESDDDADDAE